MKTFILIALIIVIDGTQASGKIFYFFGAYTYIKYQAILLRVLYYILFFSLQISLMLKRSAMMVMLLTTKQLTSMFTVIIGMQGTTGNTVT